MASAMRCWLPLVFALSLFNALAFAAPPSPLIANVPGRTTISLNGSWPAIVDPVEAGLGNRFYQDARPKDKSDRVEYSFDLSPTLNVPGDWNTQREQLLFYENPVWYRRTFTYHRPANTRVFVYFAAANDRCRVYLNGQALGDHEGGFTPFNLEATSLLREGENFLVVEVNNARTADGVPSLRYDWWNYGGITGNVFLVEVPAVFIQDYFIQLARGSQSEIAGWVQLSGADGPQVASVDIPEAGIRQRVTTDATGRAAFRFAAKLELWSPEHPKLYDVTIASSTDTIRDQIGFRSLEVQEGKVLLNGKPIFLRGISLHDEAPFRGGRVFSTADAQTLLTWAKDLGCNFVRLAHYPHYQDEIRLADRMGLLVWSEIPLWQNINWRNAATLANAKNQLQEMITRDHNRASVILWSISNETPITPERLTFLKQLAGEARALDSTRLITSAMDHFDSDGPDQRTLSDPLGEFLDVLGINEYVGWYERRPQDAETMRWKSTWNKPLIVSEFGGEAVYGRHGDGDERWTEEYQADLYRHQLAMIQRIPYLAGMSPWILMDFRAPGRALPGVQDYYNRKGLVSDRGDRKQAFYVLQKFYHDLQKSQP
jgi:beta-glucuronidase